jgi:hypothetical protein
MDPNRLKFTADICIYVNSVHQLTSFSLRNYLRNIANIYPILSSVRQKGIRRALSIDTNIESKSCKSKKLSCVIISADDRRSALSLNCKLFLFHISCTTCCAITTTFRQTITREAFNHDLQFTILRLVLLILHHVPATPVWPLSLLMPLITSLFVLFLIIPVQMFYLFLCLKTIIV